MTKKQEKTDNFKNVISTDASKTNKSTIIVSPGSLETSLANIDVDSFSLAIASVPFLDLLLKMPKESLKRAQTIAHKAFEKITTQGKPLTLLNIEVSDQLNNMEKKIARAVYFAENPEKLKMLQDEEAYYQNQALLRTNRKRLKAYTERKKSILSQQKNQLFLKARLTKVRKAYYSQQCTNRFNLATLESFSLPQEKATSQNNQTEQSQTLTERFRREQLLQLRSKTQEDSMTAYLRHKKQNLAA